VFSGPRHISTDKDIHAISTPIVKKLVAWQLAEKYWGLSY